MNNLERSRSFTTNSSISFGTGISIPQVMAGAVYGLFPFGGGDIPTESSTIFAGSATGFGIAAAGPTVFSGGTVVVDVGGMGTIAVGGAVTFVAGSHVTMLPVQGRWIERQDAWPAAQNQVAAFAQLEPNWDGYGALPISEQTAQNTANVLTLTFGRLPEPDITPNPNGTLTLEWQRAENSATMEIGKTRFSLIVEQANMEPLLIGGRVEQINANRSFVGESISNLLAYAPVRTSNSTLLFYDSNISP
jgi:hypothetical protein